jgi:hypothetical protein
LNWEWADVPEEVTDDEAWLAACNEVAALCSEPLPFPSLRLHQEIRRGLRELTALLGNLRVSQLPSGVGGVRGS